MVDATGILELVEVSLFDLLNVKCINELKLGHASWIEVDI